MTGRTRGFSRRIDVPCPLCKNPQVDDMCKACKAYLQEREIRQRVMGNAVLRYFEGNTQVGTSEQYCCGYQDIAGGIHSAVWSHEAFFCDICGEVWGRIIYKYSFSYEPLVDSRWNVTTRRCARHGDGLFLTGKPLDSCSPELLHREALLLLNRYTQESQQ